VALEVLVVDNGSTDGSGERLAAELGEDGVLRLGDNFGYAGGMNAGLAALRERSDAPYLLVITPDALVEPEAVARLVGVLEGGELVGGEREGGGRVGVVGPLVVFRQEPDPLLGAGGVIEPGRVRAPHLRVVRGPEPYAVDWIDGCCMLLRREVLDAVEGFDERYFLYFEETDFWWLVGRAGWKVVLEPGAVVHHDKTGIVPPPHYFYYLTRNRYLFWRKNFGVRTTRVAVALAVETAGLLAAYLRSVLVPSRRGERSERREFLARQLVGVREGTGYYLAGRVGRK
jgi:GT2 family glycosyltransferase